MARYGGGRGGFGGGRMGGHTASSYVVDTRNGVSRINASGRNYSDMLSPKVELTVSYLDKKCNTLTLQQTNRFYVSNINSSQVYNDDNTSNAMNFNHRFNARLTYNIDSFNTLIWVPTLSLQANNSRSTQNGITNLESELLNQTQNQYRSELSGHNFNNMLVYFHRFRKAGRSFNIHSSIRTNSNSGWSSFWADNRYFTNPDLNDSLNQESDIDRTGFNTRN